MPEPVRIGDATLYCGDVLAVLATLPDESVHCVVSSPPYWGLRDYGTGTWEGGSAECDHKVERPMRKFTNGRGEGVDDEYAGSNLTSWTYRDATPSRTCPKCGARRIDQQIGLEETPEQYVAKMVAVFREVRRVLRSDGTAWVNLGSSYAGSGRGPTGENGIQNAEERQGFTGAPRKPSSTEGENVPAGWTNRNSDLRSPSVYGFKPKDMIPIPWMVAMALQADGWYLRSDIIWAKPNPMPESVTDRPTKAHEYVFLLTKSARYFYDADAVREITGNEADPVAYAKGDGHHAPGGDLEHGVNIGFGSKHDSFTHPSGRNRRTVWTIATEPFPGAHFATFPRKLVEPCILAGCPRKVCPECGAPWVREVEADEARKAQLGKGWHDHDAIVKGQRNGKQALGGYVTIGEHPTCDHGLPPVPGTVLDPFLGSGTTLVVALSHGRRGIGVELKPEYFGMACNRLRHGTVDPEEVREAKKQFALFGEAVGASEGDFS